jgi:hypothetical protein
MRDGHSILAGTGRPLVAVAKKLEGHLPLNHQTKRDLEAFERAIEDPRVVAIFDEKVREQEGR